MRATANLLALALTAFIAAATANPTNQEVNAKGSPERGVPISTRDLTCSLGGDLHCNGVCIDMGALTGTCIGDVCQCRPDVVRGKPHDRDKVKPKMAPGDDTSLSDATCIIGGDLHCNNVCIDSGLSSGGVCIGDTCHCVGVSTRVLASWEDRFCAKAQGPSVSCEMTCGFGHLPAAIGRCIGPRCYCFQSH